MSDETEQPDAQSEDLVAYLDGELDAGGRHRVEERLAADPHAQREMQRLERVWNLLDRLPRAEPSEQFTQSTVAMVTLAAESDVQSEQAAAPSRRIRRWLIGGASTLAAGLAGVLAISLAMPDQNKALLRDLPVLENLEVYKQADSVEFLQKLRDEGLFGEESDDAG